MMQLKKEYCRVGINDEGNLTIDGGVIASIRTGEYQLGA